MRTQVNFADKGFIIKTLFYGLFLFILLRRTKNIWQPDTLSFPFYRRLLETIPHGKRNYFKTEALKMEIASNTKSKESILFETIYGGNRFKIDTI